MCVFRVTGEKLDPDSALAISGLPAYRVFHAGAPRSSARPDERYELSGFCVDAGPNDFDDLPAQVADAIAFLDEFGDRIALLRGLPGLDDMRLDFAVDLRIDRKTIFAQFDYFPPELVSKAGALGLGIEISIYPPDLEELARARKENRSGRR